METGATDIIDQPLTPEAAADRMMQLKESPEFMKRVGGGDAEAFAEYNKLWRVSRGLPETPQPPQSKVEVDAEADARTVAAVQQHAAVLAAQGFDEKQQIQIV